MVLSWLLMLSFALLSTPALAAQKYRVTVSLVHLGEVVAAPVIIAEEGQTTRIYRDDPPNFTMGVLIQTMDDGQLQVSMDYSSGNLSAQPNLVVPIGEPYQTSTKKVILNLQIDPIED